MRRGRLRFAARFRGVLKDALGSWDDDIGLDVFDGAEFSVPVGADAHARAFREYFLTSWKTFKG